MEVNKTLLVLFVLFLGVTWVHSQPFQCPLDDNDACIDGDFASPNSCSNFYRCTLCTAVEMECVPSTDHFNPYSQQCEDPSQARCDGSFIEGSLFTVVREGGEMRGPGDVYYNTELANYGNPYHYSSATVLTNAPGTYFFHLSGGARPGYDINFQIDGLPYPARVYGNNPLHLMDILSRDIMATLDQSVTLKTSIPDDSIVASTADRSTLWAGFRLEEFMSSTIAFCANSPNNISAVGDMVFSNVLVATDNSYSVSTGRFTAPVSGVYLFAFSSEVATDNNLRAVFQSSQQGIISSIWRTTRFADFHFVDTLSKSVVVELQAGEYISVALQTGLAVTTVENSLTFSGFLLAPRHGIQHAWATYRTTNAASPMDPVLYDVVSTNLGALYDEATGVVTPTVSGYYFVTYAAGTTYDQSVSLRLIQSTDGFDASVIGIYRSDDIGEYFDVDTIGRSVVVYLTAGDSLRVQLELGAMYTDDDRIASFSGFLLQAASPPTARWNK